MAKRNSPKDALAGLRFVQKLGTLAVPLEKVPEENEVKADTLKPQIFGTDDWKGVEHAVKDILKNNFFLGDQGKIYNLHQNVKNILRSRTGTFLFDCYREWLAKDLCILAAKFKNYKDSQLLRCLEEVWCSFYQDTLPLLEAVLMLLKPKGRQSVRSTTLAAFRDVVFFAEDIEGAISNEIDYISAEIQHSIFILQNVNDSYPPCKNKLRLESLAAQISSPFMGYVGLFENGQLLVPSNEPAKRRPSADVGPRRISRPFSVQPQQMDTLNQVFKKAIRNKSLKVEGTRSKKHHH